MRASALSSYQHKYGQGLNPQVGFSPLLWAACEQTLWGALAVGWEKEGELATMSLEFEFHVQFPCGSLSTELLDFCQSAQSGNEHECKQTLKNRCQGQWPHIYKMSSLPISIWHQFFQCSYSNSRDVEPCKPSSLFLPCCKNAPERLLTS